MGDETTYAHLEHSIDAVMESYADERLEINNLKSSRLPNKRRVVAALRELEPALFMGFYATSRLTQQNLRHAIAERLYRAHELLEEEVERALRYEGWQGPCAGASCSTATVLKELFAALPRVRVLLNGDVRAAFLGDPSAASVEEIIFGYPSIRAITTYRIAHELWKLKVPLIPRILSEDAHSATGIDIHPAARIGERFFIDHGTGVVVGETAVIGDDVKLYQGVTLGALSVPRRGVKTKRHPTLEDRVTVYSGATILGGDTIVGAGAVIGGNQWVTHSVPPGTIHFGHARGGQGS